MGVLLKNLQSETQIIYKALLCLWLMSYNDHVASQFHHETNVIPNIIVVLKAVPKEKIIRIGTAVLAVSISLTSFIYLVINGSTEYRKQRT